jgi:hypothetical protein
MHCFRTADKTLITCRPEWDVELGRWHISVGGHRRRPTDEEVSEAILVVHGEERSGWTEGRFVANPFVRHFFSRPSS